MTGTRPREAPGTAVGTQRTVTHDRHGRARHFARATGLPTVAPPADV